MNNPTPQSGPNNPRIAPNISPSLFHLKHLQIVLIMLKRTLKQSFPEHKRHNLLSDPIKDQKDGKILYPTPNQLS